LILKEFGGKIYKRMPKEAQSPLSKVRAHAARYPAEFMVTTCAELFCTLCSTTVSNDRKSSVDKHRQSTKHQKKIVINIAATTAATKHTHN